MTPIEKILNTGPSMREDVPMPGNEEICRVETALGFRFPESYLEFVRLGGLGELCFDNRILPPIEILESVQWLPDREHVPFADNGCGDLYCWPRNEGGEPPVLFADHEMGYQYSEVAPSFTQWLQEQRF